MMIVILSSRLEFAELLTRLRGKVFDCVKEFEVKLKEKFAAYQKEENDKRKQELEARHQQRLKWMTEAQAKECTEHDKEKAELQQRQRDLEAKSRHT